MIKEVINFNELDISPVKHQNMNMFSWMPNITEQVYEDDSENFEIHNGY